MSISNDVNYVFNERNSTLEVTKGEISHSVKCVAAASFAGMQWRFESRHKERSQKPHISLMVNNIKVLVPVLELSKIGLSADQITGVKNSEDRSAYLNDALNTKTVLVQEISPWAYLAESIKKQLQICRENQPSVELEAMGWINKIVQQGKLHVFARFGVGNLAVAVGRSEEGRRFDVGSWSRKFPPGGTASVTEFAMTNVQKPSEKKLVAIKTLRKADKAIKELEGYKKTKGIDGVIEPLGGLEDPDSDQVIGLVFPAFTSDLAEYLNRLIRGRAFIDERSKIAVKILDVLLAIIGRMHEKGLVHTDIKCENVFAKYTTSPKIYDISHEAEDLSEIVLADIGETDPLKKYSSFTFRCNLLRDLQKMESSDNQTDEERIALRKRMDIRQLGFLMYQFLSYDLSSKDHYHFFPFQMIKINGGHLVTCPDSSYRPLTNREIPEGLKTLVEELVTSNSLTIEEAQTKVQELKKSFKPL